MIRIAIVIIFALGLSCKEQVNVSKSEVGQNEVCTADAKWLQTWINSVFELNGKTKWGLDDFEELRLGMVEREIEVPKSGPAIMMGPDKVSFGWTSSKDLSQALIDLEKSRNLLKGVLPSKSSGKTFKFYVDIEAHWSEIVSTLERLRPEEPLKLAFVFRKQVEGSFLPLNSDFERNLIKRYRNRRLKPGEAVLYHGLSPEAEKECSKCPIMVEMMKSAFTQDSLERSILLNDRLVKAYKECNCNVSKDALTSTIWRLLFVGTPDNPKQPTVKYFTLAGKQAKNDVVEFRRSKDSVWQDVYKDLLKIDSEKQVVFISE